MDDRNRLETSKTYLKDVDPLWRAFWFHMHLMAKNLPEFAVGLGQISDEVFAYHVSGQKNDLARWVREVIGDAVLAQVLDQVHNKEEAAAAVQARVLELTQSVG
jgi:hypothetical protein